MPMEQAKWYTIRFNFLAGFERKERLKLRYHKKLFVYQLTEDLHFKRVVTFYNWPYECDVFIGQKKLNKLIKEAHLLGLEDELLIFERRASNA